MTESGKVELIAVGFLLAGVISLCTWTGYDFVILQPFIAVLSIVASGFFHWMAVAFKRQDNAFANKIKSLNKRIKDDPKLFGELAKKHKLGVHSDV